MIVAPRRPHAGLATILVVDDDPAVRDVVADLLAEQGYRVRCAAHGQEALAIVASEPIDLIISDVLMPRLDGPSLVRRLRQQGYDQPIVLMSAHTTGVPGELPDISFVRKPFDISRLLRLVDDLVEGREP